MYGFQVRVWNPHTKKEQWEWVHPTGGIPYHFNTEDEAQRMREMCYPEHMSSTRVAKFEDEA